MATKVSDQYTTDEVDQLFDYLLRWNRMLRKGMRTLSERCDALEAQLPAVHGLRKVLEEERRAKLEEISSLEVKS